MFGILTNGLLLFQLPVTADATGTTCDLTAILVSGLKIKTTIFSAVIDNYRSPYDAVFNVIWSLGQLVHLSFFLFLFYVVSLSLYEQCNDTSTVSILVVC